MYRNPGFNVGILLMIVLFIVTACSGGSDPTSGSLTGGNEALTASQNLTAGDGSRSLWGYWHLVINPETRHVDILPVRGIMFHVNAVEWMQPPAGKVENLDVEILKDNFLTEGRFDLDVTLTHPFPGLDTLTGWDVMGVFLTDGHAGLLDTNHNDVLLSDGGSQDATMLNPDGYTRWWNQDEFDDPNIRIFSYIPGALGANAASVDAIINPYKYFHDGLSATGDVSSYLTSYPDLRGIFSAGAENTRRYELQWPMFGGIPQFEFDYAVVASWEPPDPNPPVDVFVDFPVTANAPEPVALSTSNTSDFWFSEGAGTAGGDLHLLLETYCYGAKDNPNGIADSVQNVIIELVDSIQWPGGVTRKLTGSTSVIGSTVNSSTYQADFTDIPAPSADGLAPAIIIFETDGDYSSGFGTNYPVGAFLSSYFYIQIPVSPWDPSQILPPQCENPVPEYADRNIMDIEEYTADVIELQGEPFDIEWSVEPTGSPPVWINLDTDTIVVNWWNVLTDSNNLPPPIEAVDYDICVRVYDLDGENQCCTTVTVNTAPTIEGDPPVTITPQPDQGFQPPDLTVSNTGAGSRGEILYQDTLAGEVKLYRFVDNYSMNTLVTTLGPTGYIPNLDDPINWNDYHKFDCTHSGDIIHLTSANKDWPSVPLDVLNDPMHCFVMPYSNTGSLHSVNYLTVFGDVSSGSGDPDNLPWKQLVDWTSGVTGNSGTSVYGLFVISDLWLPIYPSETHPGNIYVAWSNSPYADAATDLDGMSLPTMSSQNLPVAGPIDDTVPDLMALGMDDDNWWQANFVIGSGEWLDDITVWYMLDSDPTAADRKVHIILLPKNYDDPTWDTFFYLDYIGTGGDYDLDFQGGTPVDLEVVYSSNATGLDHRTNWLAVLVDTGPGWRVDVFRLEFAFNSLVPVGSFESTTGNPTAIDIDTTEHEMHVLAETSGNYQVTVLSFTP